MTSTAPVAPGLGSTQEEHLEALGSYQYGWRDSDAAGKLARRGIDEDVVRNAITDRLDRLGLLVWATVTLTTDSVLTQD